MRIRSVIAAAALLAGLAAASMPAHAQSVKVCYNVTVQTVHQEGCRTLP